MENSRIIDHLNNFCKGLMVVGAVVFAVGLKLKRENETITKKERAND